MGVRSQGIPGFLRPQSPAKVRTVIRPPARWPGLGLAEAWRFRSICLVLVERSLKVRYRQTFLGAAWTVLQPILLMAVFTVFFGLLAKTPSQGLPHPVFYFLGLLPWQIVARALSEGSASVVSNSALVNKVYIPRVYFPLAASLSSLVDFLFGTVALVVLLLLFQITPGWQVVLVPVLVAIALMAGLGISLWLSALNAAYRDVAQLLPSLTQMWFFATPIIYPSAIVPPAYRALYYINPMALVVDGFRWAFAGTPAPPPIAWLLGTGVAITFLVTGYLYFRHREPGFADVV
jgi:lipopolysaccharide transport system permease protein